MRIKFIDTYVNRLHTRTKVMSGFQDVSLLSAQTDFALLFWNNKMSAK